MRLTFLLRAAGLLALTLLASCATTHSSNGDPREWSFSPQEARMLERINRDSCVLLRKQASETALADTSKGNDVVGLNRGFLFAGARSIVSSLWEVDDNATRDLMVAFYRERARHGKSGGLRQAQLAMLAKYPHPYYWAVFQMSGLF